MRDLKAEAHQVILAAPSTIEEQLNLEFNTFKDKLEEEYKLKIEKFKKDINEYKKEIIKEKEKNIYLNLYKIENQKLKEEIKYKENQKEIQHKKEVEEIKQKLNMKEKMHKNETKKLMKKIEQKEETKEENKEMITYNCEDCKFKTNWIATLKEHKKKCNKPRRFCT